MSGVKGMKRRKHQDHVREKIRATQIVNRLQNHLLGKLKNPMSPSQVSAAKILMDKAVSNAPTEIDVGDDAGGLRIHIHL